MSINCATNEALAATHKETECCLSVRPPGLPRTLLAFVLLRLPCTSVPFPFFVHLRTPFPDVDVSAGSGCGAEATGQGRRDGCRISSDPCRDASFNRPVSQLNPACIRDFASAPRPLFIAPVQRGEIVFSAFIFSFPLSLRLEPFELLAYLCSSAY